MSADFVLNVENIDFNQYFVLVNLQLKLFFVAINSGNLTSSIFFITLFNLSVIKIDVKWLSSLQIPRIMASLVVFTSSKNSAYLHSFFSNLLVQDLIKLLKNFQKSEEYLFGKCNDLKCNDLILKLILKFIRFFKMY